jgi:hypothetical protein
MFRLLAFLNGQANREEANDVKDHLLECTRCLFVYGQVRKTVSRPDVPAGEENASEGSVPAVLRDNSGYQIHPTKRNRRTGR